MELFSPVYILPSAHNTLVYKAGEAWYFKFDKKIVSEIIELRVWAVYIKLFKRIILVNRFYVKTDVFV